jgi:hypothetical protein
LTTTNNLRSPSSSAPDRPPPIPQMQEEDKHGAILKALHDSEHEAVHPEHEEEGGVIESPSINHENPHTMHSEEQKEVDLEEEEELDRHGGEEEVEHEEEEEELDRHGGEEEVEHEEEVEELDRHGGEEERATETETEELSEEEEEEEEEEEGSLIDAIPLNRPLWKIALGAAVPRGKEKEGGKVVARLASYESKRVGPRRHDGKAFKAGEAGCPESPKLQALPGGKLVKGDKRLRSIHFVHPPKV